MVPTSVGRYLQSDFLKSFVNEANPGNWEPSQDKGVFAITMQCFAYWNAATGLYNGEGEATSAETVAFMSARLGHSPAPFGNRYRSRAALLYSLFRHGLIHQRHPGEIVCGKGTLSWVLGRDLQDAHHVLLLGPMLPTDKPRHGFGVNLQAPVFRRMPKWFIGLKPDLLFEHSRAAFEAFATECEGDAALAQTVANGIAKASLPREIESAQIAALAATALSQADPWP